MAKYYVNVEFSGYVRGNRTYLVEAESEKEAERNWDCGDLVSEYVVRDDTSFSGVSSVMLIEEED